MKKIAFVISSLRAGGAERVLSTIANELAKEDGLEITIITVNEADPFYRLESGINLISLDVKNNKNSIINTFQRIKATYRSLKKIKPSVVISFNTTTSCETIIAARLLKLPIIISERANPNTSAPSLYWKMFRRLAFPLANHLVCQTEASKVYYKWIKRSSIIFNPIKEMHFRTVPKNKSLLAVGSLRAVKGFDLLIEAYKKLIDRNPSISDWSLNIVGEGPERSKLEKLINQENLHENVFLVGKQQNIEHFYGQASIFILSSRSEGMPNVLLEAMSFGLPCISFDCDFGPNEIINNRNNGILVPNGDVFELSKSIEFLVNNPDVRGELSKNAINTSKRYDIATVTKQWKEIIRKIS